MILCRPGPSNHDEGVPPQCRTKVCRPKSSHSRAITAIPARPITRGRRAPARFPGIVVVMHLPGWDEWIIEVTRKFAHHGYAAIAPHLYFREGPGQPRRHRRARARGRRRGGCAGGRRRRRRGRLSARAAELERQGRDHRVLLGRPARLSRRPAARPASTRWWIAGAATWWWTIRNCSTPNGRSRRSI